MRFGRSSALLAASRAGLALAGALANAGCSSDGPPELERPRASAEAGVGVGMARPLSVIPLSGTEVGSAATDATAPEAAVMRGDGGGEPAGQGSRGADGGLVADGGAGQPFHLDGLAPDAAGLDGSTATVADDAGGSAQQQADGASSGESTGGLGGPSPSEDAGSLSPPLLKRATAEAGLEMIHLPDDAAFSAHGYMTGGAAVGDFDGDGYADLFVPSAGQSAARLFINQRDGTFLDAAADWGLTSLHAGNGAAVGDYDGDGRLDVFVTSFGVPGQPAQAGYHRLYRNTGAGFVDVAAEAGVATAYAGGGGDGAAFGDYDLDGDLDLFVCMWTPYDGAQFLFENQGDGTFVDVTGSAFDEGVVDGVWAFQPAFADMNGDGYPELLITGDFHTSRYLVNDGDGTFSDGTSAAGLIDQNGMGQTIFDVDRDGRPDWHVSSIFVDDRAPEDNRRSMLYRSTGPHAFEEISLAAGVADQGWGWGVVALDLDQDGRDDIATVNGREAVGGEWEKERGKLFHAQPDGTFVEIAAEAGFDHAESGRALVYLDAEHDGDLDLVVVTNAGPLAYYENVTPAPGHWLQIVLDTSGRPDLAPSGFGARVEVVVGGVTLSRVMNGAPSYLGTSELVAHFGLGTWTSVEAARVRWPDGATSNVSVDGVDRRVSVAAPPAGG